VPHQARSAIVQEFFFSYFRFRAQGDDRQYGLSPLLIRDPDSGSLKHHWVSIENILDLTKVNVLAAGDNQVFFAIHNEEIPILIEIADVAGVAPPASQCISGRLGIHPISLHHRRAAHHNLSPLASREGAIVIINDAILGIRRLAPS
jgi:hypothetical protein